MNNQQICNPKTEVPKGIYLNDKDYIEGMLTVCKDMEKNLTVALTEASNEKLYHTIFDMFTDIANLQRETYELWFKKGWFILEKAQKEKIDEKFNKLEQEIMDLDIDEDEEYESSDENQYQNTDEESYEENKEYDNSKEKTENSSESELDEITEEEE